MSNAFRPLVTAGAAGILLCGLYFIPSAHADDPVGSTHRHEAIRGADLPGGDPAAPRRLALGTTEGTGATPYLVGGAGVLCAGAGLAARTVQRRNRTA